MRSSAKPSSIPNATNLKIWPLEETLQDSFAERKMCLSAYAAPDLYNIRQVTRLGLAPASKLVGRASLDLYPLLFPFPCPCFCHCLCWKKPSRWGRQLLLQVRWASPLDWKGSSLGSRILAPRSASLSSQNRPRCPHPASAMPGRPPLRHHRYGKCQAAAKPAFVASAAARRPVCCWKVPPAYQPAMGGCEGPQRCCPSPRLHSLSSLLHERNHQTLAHYRILEGLRLKISTLPSQNIILSAAEATGARILGSC